MDKKINKGLFLLSFAIFLFIFSNYQAIVKYFAQAQTQESYDLTSWFTYLIQNGKDYDGVGKPDCNTTFLPMNETFLEIKVQKLGRGNYKWQSALCNLTPMKVGKWEYNPATDVWTYTGELNYGNLTDYGMPSNWCNETNNTGFVIFSSGQSKDKRFRLNFTEGHKYVQICTGKGSEIKEAMPSKYYDKMIRNYRNFEEWVKEKSYDSYLNGEEFWLEDWNINITLIENKVKVNSYINQTRLMSLNENAQLFPLVFVFPRFACFEYPRLGNFNSLRCPENYTNYNESFYRMAKEELVLGKRTVPEHATASTSLLWLEVDNKTGNLTSYSLKENFDENQMYEKVKRKLEKAASDYKNLQTWLNFTLEYNLSGSSHCLIFPLPRYSNITLNVTMPSEIKNFTLGNYPQIIKYNYIQGNSLIAGIRVYPCCGVQNMTIQEVEVCS